MNHPKTFEHMDTWVFTQITQATQVIYLPRYVVYEWPFHPISIPISIQCNPLSIIFLFVCVCVCVFHRPTFPFGLFQLLSFPVEDEEEDDDVNIYFFSFPPWRLFSFQNASPAFCRRMPYIALLSRHSPPYSRAAAMLSLATWQPGSSTLRDLAMLSAWSASLMESEMPNPGRWSSGGA